MSQQALAQHNPPFGSPHDRDLRGDAQPRAASGGSPYVEPLEAFASIEEIIEEYQPTEPIFCIDPFEIRTAVSRFLSFPGRPLYAVKCNAHPFVLDTLFEAGIRDFDVASLGEIEQIERQFGKAAGLYFNNPAKSRPSIRRASQVYGVRFYTADCMDEVDKILDEADLRDELIIAVRLATPGRNARYVLSTKFGAPPDDAAKILKYVYERGVKAGISFHVGSQCLSPGAFGRAMSISGSVARKAGVPISVLNVGGGFPAPYPGDKIASLRTYFSHVIHGRQTLDLAPGYMLLCEPGRSLVATSGTLIVQVMVRRGQNLHLNDGVFGTLQELGHPSEHRPLRLIRNGERPEKKPADFRIFGPTCDSNDALGAPFSLPEDIREGDWIEIGMMGAYSLSMRTQFNGFHTEKIVRLSG
ncbi:MAG: type III PLP-dependent enzyme [Pseudomonadota bacterium]